MSEKYEHPHQSGHEENDSQIQQPLECLSAEELQSAFLNYVNSTDEFTYDVKQANRYLELLEKAGHPMPDTKASLASFHEKYDRKLEQAQSALLTSMLENSSHRPIGHLVARIAAIALVVMLSFGAAAQAMGFDLLSAIASWTKETFQLSSAYEEEVHSVNEDFVVYQDLQAAADELGIAIPVVPQWVPEGFVCDNVAVESLPGFIKIKGDFLASDRFFSITIKRFISTEEVDANYEKDEDGVFTYEQGGVTHYIMGNNLQVQAVWNYQTVICTITGDLSSEEVMQMIDSIYEE